MHAAVRLLAMTGLLVAMHWSTAVAESWYLEPRASMSLFYEDNIRLTPSNQRDSAGGFARGELRAGRRTEISDVALTGVVDHRTYLDAAELDRTNFSLALDSQLRRDRQRFSLKAQFDYDSTLTSEEQTTGFVQVDKRRSRFHARPSWHYSLTERAGVALAFGFEDVRYEDVELTPLFDYRLGTMSLAGEHAWTERLKLLGQASYEHYQADRISTETTSYGMEAGFGYALSERSTVQLKAGLRQTEYESRFTNNGRDSSSTGPTFELGWKRDYKWGELNLSANRALLPSGQGVLLDTTGMIFGMKYRVAPLWNMNVNAQAFRNRDPNSDIRSRDRDYVTVTPRIEHRLTQSLGVDLSYRFRWQRRDWTDEEASANAIFLTLSYTSPREQARAVSVAK